MPKFNVTTQWPDTVEGLRGVLEGLDDLPAEAKVTVSFKETGSQRDPVTEPRDLIITWEC